MKVPERIPYAVCECCIKEYKVLMVFEEDATGIATSAYIFGFEDYKVRLGRMLP